MDRQHHKVDRVPVEVRENPQGAGSVAPVGGASLGGGLCPVVDPCRLIVLVIFLILFYLFNKNSDASFPQVYFNQ